MDFKAYLVSDPMTLATAVIAGATIVNALLSVLLWWTTRSAVQVSRDIFAAAHRPYVGQIISRDLDHQARRLGVTLSFQNFGTVPAENVENRSEFLLNGVKIPKAGPGEPATFFQGVRYDTFMGFDTARFESIVSGAETLEVIAHVSYEGPGNRTYVFCEESRFDHRSGQFINLGKYTG